MKSLVLKDLYNIGHNMKSLLMVVVIFAVCFLPQKNGVFTLVATCGILCSMTIITTFSFDDQCNWMKYAMTMPISRKDMIKAKFIVLVIFCVGGIFAGTLTGTVGGILLNKFNPASASAWLSMLGTGAAGLLLAIFFGSISIPLLFRFGAEKARLFSIVSFVIPLGILLLAYYIMRQLGFDLTEALLIKMLLFSPVFLILWCLLMYKITYVMIKNKDL